MKTEQEINMAIAGMAVIANDDKATIHEQKSAAICADLLMWVVGTPNEFHTVYESFKERLTQEQAKELVDALNEAFAERRKNRQMP